MIATRGEIARVDERPRSLGEERLERARAREDAGRFAGERVVGGGWIDSTVSAAAA